MNSTTEYDNLLKRIDSIELVPDEELKSMDFYELAFYVQALNQVAIIADNDMGLEDLDSE